MGQAPVQTATPKVRISMPRYIGLRVTRYGPRMTSARLAGEVGLISVPSRRNRRNAQIGGMKAATTRTIPSSACGRPGRRGHPSAQLAAAAASISISAHTGGGNLNIALTIGVVLSLARQRNDRAVEQLVQLAQGTR